MTTSISYSRAELTIYIYALCDPQAPDVPRYIGQSYNPYQRLIAHWGSLDPHDRTARAQWIRELKAVGRRPVLMILAEADTLPLAICLCALKTVAP